MGSALSATSGCVVPTFSTAVVFLLTFSSFSHSENTDYKIPWTKTWNLNVQVWILDKILNVNDVGCKNWSNLRGRIFHSNPAGDFFPELWPSFILYLLSDSRVRRIIVPTTCCTRLALRAGDLLLHRSFSSIYLKRQRERRIWVTDIILTNKTQMWKADERIWGEKKVRSCFKFSSALSDCALDGTVVLRLN